MCLLVAGATTCNNSEGYGTDFSLQVPEVSIWKVEQAELVLMCVVLLPRCRWRLVRRELLQQQVFSAHTSSWMVFRGRDRLKCTYNQQCQCRPCVTTGSPCVSKCVCGEREGSRGRWRTKRSAVKLRRLVLSDIFRWSLRLTRVSSAVSYFPSNLFIPSFFCSFIRTACIFHPSLHLSLHVYQQLKVQTVFSVCKRSRGRREGS